MKQQKLKSLHLNKKSISNFNDRVKGGAFTYDVICQTAPLPGPDSNHTCYFSCAGNDMPSCRYTDCR
ncbi:hypothetical protein [Kordia sp.]|uniref:hypothetical protein n=1 Tax=Kordia sp. TaxID=1965332 RepID=UPI003D2CF382